MIVVREFFVAKPGQASKLAKMMKEVCAISPGEGRVMTDVTGEFNRVIMETEFASVSEFETRMADYSKNEAIGKIMKGYTDLYSTGGREIFKIW